MDTDCPICLAKRGVCPQCLRAARAKFYPGRIEQGRLARGMTRRQLAEAVGLSLYKLGRFESGKARPDEATIERFGEALRFPRTFFSRPPFELPPPLCPAWGGTA